VNPDQITIDKNSLRIEKKVVNKKLRQYSLKENGTEEENVPAELQDICCVDDNEILELARYFNMIDRHYMVPMDIEWAIDRDLPFPKNVFLVQARPVTIKAKQKPASKLFVDMFLDYCRDGLRDKKVLVVDDEPDILDTVAEALDSSDVRKAADFETADKYLATEKFDIVVLDIMGVNGFELLKTSVAKGFPTVMFTAHALSPDALAKANQLGASGFVPKEKIIKLKDYLYVALMKGDEAAWREIADQLEPLFNKRFGIDWKKNLNL
jgi:CheY-like chemotaxis protein